MSRTEFKPGNMLYPLPVILVSCTDGEGHDDVMTAAWAGTVCSSPAMVSVSIRPERYSHELIEKSGEFVINLTTKDLCFATDYCGVKSGRDEDKFSTMHLTKLPSRKVMAPSIGESPVCLECKVCEVKRLGSHDMYIAEVVAVTVDDTYMDEAGRFDLNASDLLAYSHGEYFLLGEKLGKFGYSVKK